MTLFFNWTFSFAQMTPIDSLGANDKIIASLKSQFTLSSYDQPGRVLHFNKDTILIVGYLSDYSIGNSPKNIVYQTFDGGKHWIKNHFKGDAWIYDACFSRDGKVWMGGSDELIHFSKDFGTNWTTKSKPFKPINRVLSVYMIDSLKGIAGGLHNGLAITNDNWETTKQIPSPLDQNRFTITKNSARNNVDKVQLIDSLILINQNEHIYFSKFSPIEWKSFNIPTVNFSINKSTKQIEISSLGNKIYVLDLKLNLIKTYTSEPDDSLVTIPKNKSLDLSSFLSSEIESIKIKAVKYDYAGKSRGCMPFSLYKENSKEFTIKEQERISMLRTILITTENYPKPLVQAFKFSEKDFENYFAYYKANKKTRQDEKVWGGDFTSLLNINNDNFLNPNKTISNLNQSLLDKVYKTPSFDLPLFNYYEPYTAICVIGKNSDTLTISNKNANLFSLPWTLELKAERFFSYDNRLTDFVRATLPKKCNYFDKLYAGKLIYKIVVQKTIDGLEYKNNYR